MSAQITIVGVTHKTAPLSVRERMGVGSECLETRLERLRSEVGECAILNTCGRLEMILVAPPRDGERWIEHFAKLTSSSTSLVRRYARVKTGRGAARYLLTVAAGLDSQITGDEQIVPQIRSAFRHAQAAGSIGPVLSALFRAAIHTGKRVRRETAISQVTRSFAHEAVEHVQRTLDGDAAGTILVIGSGNLAQSVVTALARRPQHLVIASRYPRRARELAGRFNGTATTLDRLSYWLNRANAVITCTSSHRPVVIPGMIQRAGPDLTIVDLGMPRNVSPDVGRIGRVRLCSLDRLVPADVPAPDVLVAARDIVTEELNRFLAWRRGRAAAAKIAEAVRLAEKQGIRGSRMNKKALHRVIKRIRSTEEAA